MAINADLFIHDSDRAALNALKAIPGFTPLIKGFMKIWDEKLFRITTMSSCLRLNENQLKKYHDMLLPICEKLDIDVPELYIELDVIPNAYTYGDTNPIIVMTSGLLETIPDELIPTVLAHECGHIVCHHTLYTTMGRLILNGAAGILGLGTAITLPLQMAFAYWMRCSEFSADRIAAVCDGAPDKMMEVCMRFAGYDKDINGEANIEEFMNQALEYKKMVDENKWNKALEFLMFNQNSHPLTAVRAYECNEWGNSENFHKVTKMLADSKETLRMPSEIPMPESSKYFIGKDYQEIVSYLRIAGFKSITCKRDEKKGRFVKEGQIVSIKIDGVDTFNKGDWISLEAEIEIEYYGEITERELMEQHPGEVRIPDSSWRYHGRNYHEVVEELLDKGFIEIRTEPVYDVKKGRFSLVKPDTISQITINGKPMFNKGDWFMPDAVIKITFHAEEEQ